VRTTPFCPAALDEAVAAGLDVAELTAAAVVAVLTAVTPLLTADVVAATLAVELWELIGADEVVDAGVLVVALVPPHAARSAVPAIPQVAVALTRSKTRRVSRWFIRSSSLPATTRR